MAAHRYWRLYITENYGGTLTGISEIIPYFDGLPVDLSGVTASASSEFNGTNAASAAIDGNINNAWYTVYSELPCWWQLDFGVGNEVEISGFYIWPYYVSYSTFAPKNFVLQYSDNAVDWVDVVTFIDFPNEFPVIYNIDFGGDVLVTPPSFDCIYGGEYSISGTITEQGIPGKYRVQLFDQHLSRIVAQTWSDSTTGAYSFDYLNETPFYVVAFDHTTPIRVAAIQDNVVASDPTTIVDLNIGGTDGDIELPSYPLILESPDLEIEPFTLILRSAPDVDPITATLVSTTNDDIVVIEAITPPDVDPITATLIASMEDDTVEIAASMTPGAITATINVITNDDVVEIEWPGNIGIPTRTAVIDVATSDDIVEISSIYTPTWIATVDVTTNDDIATVTTNFTEYSGPGFINVRTNDDIVSGFLVRQVYDVEATIDATTNDDVATFSVTTPAFIEAEALSDLIGISDAITGVVSEAPLHDYIGITDWVGVGTLPLHDYIQVSDAITGILKLLGPLEDTIGVSDQVGAFFNATLSDSIGVSEVWTTTRLTPALHDRIQISDELAATLSLIGPLADTIGVQDEITAVSFAGLSDLIGVEDAITGQLFNYAEPLADNIGILDAIGATITVYAALSDEVGISDAITGQLSLIGVLSDTIGITDWVATTEATTVHVVNAETGAVSTYTFTPRVKGMGQFQGTLFLAAADGLYAVDADQDEAGDIVWTLQTGFNNLGSDQLKQIHDVNCQMRTEGDTIMHVISDRHGEKESWRYRLTQDTRDSYRDGVIKPGKGTKSVYYALGLQGVGPAEIDQLRVLVRPLPRRR